MIFKKRFSRNLKENIHPDGTKILKVQEALQEWGYKGVIGIDPQIMEQIGVRPGDIIEIEGNRKTLGIVDKIVDNDQSIIRMDGLLRRNAKTGIGELVKIRKVEVKEAKAVIIAPAQPGVKIQADSELFKKSLLGRPILKGDIVALGGTKSRKKTMTGSPFEDIFDVFEQGFMGGYGFGSLKFIVADTTPKEPVIITEKTLLTIDTELSDDSGLPESMIIQVKKSPNINKLTEVKDISDIKRLAKHVFINKFEDSKQIIYHTEGYFLKIEKLETNNKSKLSKKDITTNKEKINKKEEESEYIKCFKCGHQTFINRICFRIDDNNQKIIVDQKGDNLFCDKCGTKYEFYKFISYPYKKDKL